MQRQRNRRTNPNHKNRSGEEVRDRTGEVEEQENLKSRKETEQEKFLQQINQKERNHKEKGSSRLKEMRAVLAKHKITRGVSPEKLRLILEDLGPTYIKLGQIMSLHSDILPKAYCDELMKLNSEVTPMPFEAVLRVIEQSYGISWQEVFRFIDDKALGSASIAQVHRAQLLDGKDVIVKVEREEIYDLMSRDIALLHKAVKFLPPVGDLKNLVDLDMILDEMWSVAQEEMDFLKEAANMEEFAKNHTDVAYVYVPKLYKKYTTSHVLVMEYIRGIPIDDAETLESQGYDLNEIGRKFVNSFIQQVMEDGFFHADPHPGNVRIRAGKIVWLDMGMMGRLSERDRKIMVRGVEGIALHDTQLVTNAVLDLCDFWGEPDRDRLYDDIKLFLEKYGTTAMGKINIADTMQALMEIMKANKLAIPHGMTMLARGFAHIEGVLAKIAPDINMVDIAALRVQDSFLGRIDFREEAGKILRSTWRAIHKGPEIPSMTAEIMSEYLKGKARVNLKLDASEELRELVFQSVRNLVTGICITALLVSSSIICMTDMEPKVHGIPALGFIGYLIAFGAMGFFLLRFLIRKIKK